MQQGKNMPLLFWSHESVDMFLFLCYLDFCFQKWFILTKHSCTKQNCPVVQVYVLSYLWLWQSILKFFENYVKNWGLLALKKKLQLLGFASVSLYHIFWFIYLVENSSDQKINVIFLVHRSNSSFWNELMKRLLRKFFELSAF